MTKFMTEETPVKVISLLGVAVSSMFFLFAVTVTTSSNTKFPDPFAPENVVSALDNVSHDYAFFLDQNLFQPAAAQYAFVADNVGFVADNAGSGLADLMGLPASSPAQASAPQVAGASDQVVRSQYYPVSSGSGMFSFLLGN